MRALKKFFLVLVCLTLVRFLCLQATQGFTDWKIKSNLPHCPEWETEPVPLQSIIEQSFSYLGHGAQCYAFSSEDGEYVLKFYRHNRASHPLAFLNPICLKIGCNQLKKTLHKREEKRLRDFASYMLAKNYLACETGLVYLHLNPTKHIQKKVVLYDKIGVVHHIDLDQTVFILQKKAAPVYTTLKHWIRTGEIETAKQGLTQLLTILARRAKQGLSDKDPDLRTNFGFTDAGPIQFDIGRYKEDPTKAEKTVYREDLLRATDKLCRWLRKKRPELSDHVKREIERI